MVDVARFSDAEQRVWEAFPAGTLVDFRVGDAESDDPASADSWGPDRQIRAEVLNALLCGAVEVEPGQEGAVHLQGASVIGKIGLYGINFKHVLRLEGCCIADGIELREATTRSIGLNACQVGPIKAIGAKINGTFSLVGAHLHSVEGVALIADQLAVTMSMFCNGLRSDGSVVLAGARIGGELNFRGAHLDGKGGPALMAQQATVTATMFCDQGFRAEGDVSLAGMNIGVFEDDRESWPEHLNLYRLAYGELTDMPARERLDWLNLSVQTAGYSPQPYEELAAYYRRMGHDERARRILLAKLRQRTLQRPWWARWWGWLQDGLAGYGYAPGRALLLLAGAFVAGWLVFRTRQPVPVGPGPHPTFNAALYSLDVLIPAPALGQASEFDPQGVGLVVAVVLHLLGWLLAITVIAAITRSFSRT